MQTVLSAMKGITALICFLCCCCSRGLCAPWNEGPPSASSANILNYGAVSDQNTVEDSQINSKAIEDAAKAACTARDDVSGDQQQSVCTVLVPAGHVFYIHPVLLSAYKGLTLEVSGELRAHNNIISWPRDSSNNTLDIITVSDCEDFQLTGTGTIDGQGYQWWWYAIIGGFTHLWRDHRPHILHVLTTRGIILENFRMINSPQYHVKLDDCADLVVRHVTIYVDVESQKSLLRDHGFMQTSVGATADGKQVKIEIPTFPLNTDGIDPSVNGVHIYNVSIENFDDAVAVKPCSTDPGHKYCNCSSNVLVENSTVKFGVGMTIGSVPPDDNVNCVENVTFRNVLFHEPLKGVYVKTNPGDHGSGRIKNITYENLEMIAPVWWAIYIGPQQQEQPDGGGPGCMTYPLENCETQPRVPMDDITLRNVSIRDGVNPFAGVVRCNVSRPCTGFLFENVQVKEALDTENYIVEFVDGVARDCAPSPDFGPNNKSVLSVAGDSDHEQPRRKEKPVLRASKAHFNEVHGRRDALRLR